MKRIAFALIPAISYMLFVEPLDVIASSAEDSLDVAASSPSDRWVHQG